MAGFLREGWGDQVLESVPWASALGLSEGLFGMETSLSAGGEWMMKSLYELYVVHSSLA